MAFGVVSFPGTNCETEAVRAFKNVGIDARVILWNETEEAFDACDGFLIAGGFSYEDRGRSGMVSANDHACDYLRKAAAQGKPIIGVCNGAQVLVETGLVTDSKTPEIALSINKRVKDGEVQGIGFYHDWCVLKNIARVGRSAFNNFDELIKMPLAHAEGRFIIPEDKMQEMKENDQIVFVYTDDNGEMDEHYPVNPNGSIKNIAGVCNKQGNVLAMMPHPERAQESAQVLFQGIKAWLDNNNIQVSDKFEHKDGKQIEIKNLPSADVELFIETIITDNDCETIRSAIERKIGNDLPLTRMRYLTMNTKGDPLKEAANAVVTDELANVNKERVYARYNGQNYQFQKGSGFVESSSFLGSEAQIVAVENEDIYSQLKIHKLQHEAVAVKEMHSGILWQFPKIQQDAVIATGILANPVSMYLSELS